VLLGGIIWFDPNAPDFNPIIQVGYFLTLKNDNFFTNESLT
jgi:hypothetical protein